MTQTEALKHEINLVLTDPDTNLSHGARRALDYVFGQLGSLAQPEQEPVAWLCDWDGHIAAMTQKPEHKNAYRSVTPLYTSPPQRQPLTDEQIEPIAIDVLGYGALRKQDMELFTQSVRAIEAAHGIKE